MNQKLNYVLLFVFAFCIHAGFAQSVSGTITDQQGTPLPGVNVVEKGTNNGTATDFDGNYSINVSDASGVLIFSSLGYATKEVAISGQSTINTSLADDASQLDEVVVTALGITKQTRTLGYSVTEVGGETLNKAREVNVGNSLQGRVAGLVVKGTNGGPGSTSNITLRGISSMTGGGTPLFVIDGVPMDNTQRGSASEWGGADQGDGIGNLSPDDIESMTVLKGQSASALYGTRATNGVIMITTKKGNKNADWGLSYNSNYIAESVMDFTDFQDQYGQGLLGVKPTTANEALNTTRSSWGARLDGSQVIGYDGNQYAYSPTSNRYDSFYRTGSNFSNNVSISKGWGEGSFRLSATTLDAKSIVPNSGLKRNTVNLSVSQDLGDKLNITANINYTDERSDLRPNLSDGPKNPNNFLFLAPNVDHNIFAPGFDPVTGAETVFSNDIFVTNPYFITAQGIEDPTRKRVISILSGKYNFTEDIYALLRVGNDQINDTRFSVDPWGLAYSRDLAGGLAGRGQSSTRELNVDAIFGADIDITEDLSLDVLAGTALRKRDFELVEVGGGPFILPYIYSFNNVVNFNRRYEFNQLETQSAYYSLGATYKNFLTLTTTGRYDVYSTLTSPLSDDNAIFVPSVTGAFIFDDFINWDALDFAKFRASYAVTSGDAGQAYQNQLYYNSENALNGTAVGSSPLDLPNLFLKPFTVSEYELGLDLKFFKNRLSFDMAYFVKESSDEILSSGISIASGFRSNQISTASIRNKGFEFLVNAVPVQNENFTWNTSFNITSLSNEVLSTDAGDNPINLGSNRATLGNAITAFVVGEEGPQIRAFDYARDASGAIQLDADGLPIRGELTSFGSVLPDFYGGWNNSFSYKNFNLSFLLDFNYGNKVLSATEYYSIFNGLNQITLEGRETGVGSASAQDYYQALAQRITGTSVVDGDFIKFRQLTLGYSVPNEVFDRVKFLKGIDISLVGRNLGILWRKAKNIDPENTFGSTVRRQGIEGTSLPTTRSIGLNVNFKIK